MVTESLALTQERLIDGPFVFSYIFKSKAVSHRKVQVCDKFCGLNDVAFMCSRPRLNLSLITLLVMLKHCNTPKIEFIISTVAFNAFAGANSRNNGLNQSSKNPLLDNWCTRIRYIGISCQHNSTRIYVYPCRILWKT